jgi:hypothetical protein
LWRGRSHHSEQYLLPSFYVEDGGGMPDIAQALPVEVESPEAFATMTLRELTERWPALMPLLARHGLDLCCGGGHALADAARLHGIDPDDLVAEVAAVVARETVT